MRVLKQAVFALRFRVIVAGLLVMALTITIEAFNGPTVSYDFLHPEKFDLTISPGCAAQLGIPVKGVSWKHAFSGQLPPPGTQTQSFNFWYGGKLPKEELDYFNSTDSWTARHRLLLGTSINYYDASDKFVGGLSNPFTQPRYFKEMWTGNIFDEARSFEISEEVRASLLYKRPSVFIGLGTGYLFEGSDDKTKPILRADRDLPAQNNLMRYGSFAFGRSFDIKGPGSNQGRYRLELAPGLIHPEVKVPISEEEAREEDKWFEERDSETFNKALWDMLSQGLKDKLQGTEFASLGPEDNPWKVWVAFKEPIILRFGEETDQVVPNDPLFAKEESEAKKAASGLVKGLGSILKLGGGGITAGDSPGESAKPPNQWGLLKVGYTPRSDPQSAWNIEDGSRKNVVVAVIDSGLDLTHPDGPQFLWTNSGEIPDNNIDDDANGYVDDIHGWNFVGENNNLTDDFGHGTFVTGIIAAKTNNGEGIAGINPGAQIMTLKVLNKDNKARSLAIYRAIRYAVDNGARVINMSLGGKGISRLEQIGVNYAYAQGCLVVSSSGNHGSDVAEYGPQGLRRVFSVAAINVDGKRRGSANHGANVAMTAPGEHIYSLTAKEGKRDGQITPILGTTYHTLTGTSFSAPMVAGTASLIWAKNPNLTNREVEDLLLDSAGDMDQAGWDRYNGAGLLNARRALGEGEKDRLTVRFTEVFANEEKKKIASLDVYGIVRGNLDTYVVQIGKGKRPDKWKQVFGPSSESAEYNHICRIEDELLKKGREWTVRIFAKSKTGELKSASLYIKKKR
jgi:hypothetical protein